MVKNCRGTMMKKIHVYNKIRKLGYVSRKSQYKQQKDKQLGCRFKEVIRKIARLLPQTCLKAFPEYDFRYLLSNVKEDALLVLTQWIKYIKDLQSERTRMLTLEKKYLKIEMIHKKISQRMQVLENKINRKLKDV
ncbi:uncharacterized protein LOC133188985 isoform X1 [Saccostrea echinata]|uniref:uncharacterized protein LOC133188985 isoform X1 n=1 Tax=Saccostrea echinata TaxID=191078 RepID=UPI002A83CC15|nr:uncharacterized protein LOC133188985 isoform X1 [Saccostrea echinata]